MDTMQTTRRAGRLLSLLLVLALALSCAGIAYADDGDLSPREIYANNVNATVGITTSTTVNYFGYATKAAASGSGFIYSEDGYIITNYHVIEDSETVTVATYDGKTYPAEIVGGDESNDIAVLKIDAEGLQTVTLGDSDALFVGDTVLAIGNPLGELTFSLTVGIVSAKDREVTFSSGSTMALIQTDAAINSGNSGGALFNMRGEVVGITNAKYSSSAMSGEASIDNIGFAIPINRVRGIVENIIEFGYIVKPYIGVTVANVSDELQSYGIPQGAAVQSVVEDSPAEEAGLKEKDIVTAANDVEISSSGDLVSFVSSHKPGDEVVLTVFRPGESELLTLNITLGEQKKDAAVERAESEEETESEERQSQEWPNFFGGPSFSFPAG